MSTIQKRQSVPPGGTISWLVFRLYGLALRLLGKKIDYKELNFSFSQSFLILFGVSFGAGVDLL
jgi:hypothetical protein